MDHIICINKNSFPAENKDVGVSLFNDALQGVLQLQQCQDRFLFYLDSNDGDLSDLLIAPEFAYKDFIDECEDQDLALFLAEVEDKSPALDNLTEDQIEEMASYKFYIHNEAMDDYPDVYALSWVVTGYLLSLNIDERWNSSEIAISRVDNEGRYVDDIFYLKNIANERHGLEHAQELFADALSLVEVSRPHIVSDKLSSWFLNQTKENKMRIISKVKLACSRNFQGNKPLFESLTNGNGLREIRISAYSGGAIRILFKNHHESIYALLVGFIKFSDSEGYSQAMQIAHEEYSTISQLR
ncbi:MULTISPECIES: type II toxin-antitoxin system RelE/ParE family toxin [Citrobacter]|uniref:type II toxin-antitoxin system RelE/ParE family toxin n=1 Tax=Citrobacter TaxID=544 RepID=UPI000F65B21E|nr:MULTISPECIES: type II toxin-antitoxin system RelE/ParE family toxin [Citrobacter]MDM2872070.1 type II toxin-antitoxin system RelE/ParE family toxin [Citrobacter sp. Cpo069]QXR23368.1 type II toxin-antitoxin system RelE/ParE family toxin [Citrobacter freundii]